MKKAIIFAIFAILAISTVVSAEKIIDKENDVLYVEWDENLNSYKSISSSNKPNIDIKEVSYEITSDGNIILKLKVYGNIEKSDKVFYWINLNTTERNYYVVFSNNTQICYSMKGENISTYISGELTHYGDTIVATFKSAGLGEKIEFLAYSAEYERLDVRNRWYGDWVPDKFSPVYEEKQETKEKKGLPGFELILILLAITIILWRKR
ncbi:MAG: hypothetical protein H5T45_01765 [Thermoplasmatales archaeon]|nr:hypothetical protein [Thermoplasmatales archaeon]